MADNGKTNVGTKAGTIISFVFAMLALLGVFALLVFKFAFTEVYYGTNTIEYYQGNEKITETCKRVANRYVVDDVPQRTGYEFLGLYSKDNGEMLVDSHGTIVNAFANYQKDKTIYAEAKWQPKQYIIQFDVNGGDGRSIDDISIAYGDKMTDLRSDMTKTGYDFTGWSTDVAGTKMVSGSDGVIIAERKDFVVENYNIPADGNETYFYAQWNPKTYSVTLDTAGGTLNGDGTTTVTYDATPNFAIPTRTGYTFMGWYLGATAITDGTGVMSESWTYLEDKALTADWKLTDYNITVNTEGACTAKGATHANYNDDVQYSVNIQSGYHFVGWYVNGEKKSSSLTYSFTMPAKDITITAIAHQLEHHVAQSPSCTDVGWEAYESCNHCDYTTYEEIKALGHAEEEHAGKSATCTEDGWEAYKTCKRDGCKWTTYAEIKAFGHDEEEHAGQSATCAEDGWEAYKTCKRDRCKWTTYAEIKALGHAEEEHAGKSVTCTEDGWEAYKTCKRDGCKWTTYAEIKALGHAEEEHAGKSATCTEDGWEAYKTCKRDGCKWTTYAEIKAFGHDEEEHAGQSATCTEDGWAIYNTCRRVGCAYNTYKTIPAYGHRYVEGVCSATECSAIDETYSTPGLKYSYDSETNSYVVYGYEGNSTQVLIPVTYNGFYGKHPVTRIRSNAFKNCSELTSVTLSNSVKSIGYGAFEACTSLNSVHITDISAWCEIEFGDSDSNPLSFAHNLYLNGTLVTDLMIPEEVVSIGSYAFYGCTELTNITIPDSVESIGNATFYNTTWYNNQPNGLVYAGNVAYKYKGTMPAGTEITLKENTNGIGGNAFEKCTGLTNITITVGVTNIGSSAFFGCTGLTTITISDSVTSIGELAFYNCTGLHSVHVSDIGSWCAIDFRCGIGYSYNCANPLYYAHNLYLNGVKVTDLVIPEGVIEINPWVFNACDSLKSVTIDNDVNQIGYKAFENCTQLERIIIGNSVVTIADEAFSGCKKVTSATLGNNLKKIGKWSFGCCESLTNITIPENVTNIGERAFAYCGGLTSVTWNAMACDEAGSIYYSIFDTCDNLATINIGNNVKKLPTYAFYDCSNLTSVRIQNISFWCDIEFDGVYSNPLYYAHNLYLNGTLITKLVIPQSVTGIGDYAFYNCACVTGVTIINGVTSIGDYAFYNCNNLTSVTIPDSVTSIASSAFKRTAWLDAQPDGLVYVGKVAYIYKGTMPEGTTINIKEGTISLAPGVFAYCTGLTSIFIPESVTTIGGASFGHCTGLTSITIGNGVISIGDSALIGCEKLTALTVESENAKYHSAGNCLIETESKTLIRGTSLSVIPEDGSVTSIGRYAFDMCTSLASVTIPNSVTSIGRYAFDMCTSLASVTIPNSVTSIGDGAFSSCIGLMSVTMPNGITRIGENAFYNCKSLTNITIPDSVTSIGKEAFYKCSGLTNVTIPDSAIEIGSSAFEDCSGLKTVTIGSGVRQAGYRTFKNCAELTTVNWNAEACEKTSTSAYDPEMFYGCDNIVTINIGDDVTRIPDCAFVGVTGVQSITIGEKVTYIGDQTFANCSGLSSLSVKEGNSKYHAQGNCIIETESKTLIVGCKTSIIPTDGSVTSIGRYAFKGCSGLTSITIPNCVINIEYGAFSYCSGLINVSIGNNVMYIKEDVFYQCKNIETLSWNAIGATTVFSFEGVFSGCINLATINIGSDVTCIPTSLLKGCTGITTVNWNATECVSAGSSWAPIFSGCNNLITVNIGENVRVIPYAVFCGCASLTSVTILEGVTSIGSSAFSGCTGLTSVTIPNSVTSIGSYAFDACTSLTSVTIGNGVTSIGSDAFYNCTALTEINYNVTNCGNLSSSSDVFYKAGTGGTGIKVTIGANVKSIPAYLFGRYGEPNITEVVFEDGSVCESIGSYAFSYCTSLTSVTIPDSVCAIGNSAFYNCTGLTSITFKDTTTWYRTSSSTNWNNKTGGTETDVTNSANNVARFTSNNYYWYKL